MRREKLVVVPLQSSFIRKGQRNYKSACFYYVFIERILPKDFMFRNNKTRIL